MNQLMPNCYHSERVVHWTSNDTDRHSDRETQRDRQTDRQTDRQRPTVAQTDRRRTWMHNVVRLFTGLTHTHTYRYQLVAMLQYISAQLQYTIQHRTVSPLTSSS